MQKNIIKQILGNGCQRFQRKETRAILIVMRGFDKASHSHAEELKQENLRRYLL